MAISDRRVSRYLPLTECVCFAAIMCFLCMGLESCRLTVSTRLPSDALDPPTWETIRYLVFDTHALAMWVPPFALAVLLRVITTKWKHQLLFPICESSTIVSSHNLELGHHRFPSHTNHLLRCRRVRSARSRHAPTGRVVVRSRAGGWRYG